jgi:hypothetical protein
MSHTIRTPIRLPVEYIERADNMLDAVAQDPDVNAVGRVTRASVLRMALAKGLKDMEYKYESKTKTQSSASRGRRR